MANWQSLSALLARIPRLTGARCVGHTDLFEATHVEHGRPTGMGLGEAQPAE